MRALFLYFLLFLNVSAVTARKTVKDVIKTMPEDIIPYLQDEQWAEIYNFMESKDTLEVKNALNGMTSIDSISESFAKISLNKITEMQIKLLPCNDTTEIICLVKTINRPVKESTVQFFSTNWDYIDDDFNLPNPGDMDAITGLFMERPDSMSEDKFQELSSYMEPVMINADISGADNTIIYNLSLPFIPNDKSEEIKAIIKQNTFKWDGGRFKKC